MRFVQTSCLPLVEAALPFRSWLIGRWAVGEDHGKCWLRDACRPGARGMQPWLTGMVLIAVTSKWYCRAFPLRRQRLAPRH